MYAFIGRRRPCLGPRRTSFRPHAQAMEDRLLLATITVNTTADDIDHTDSTLSLREAIQVANGTLPVTSLSPLEQQQISGPLTNPAPNEIDFGIPTTDPGFTPLSKDRFGRTGTWTIRPTRNGLDPITRSVFINGF